MVKLKLIVLLFIVSYVLISCNSGSRRDSSSNNSINMTLQAEAELKKEVKSKLPSEFTVRTFKQHGIKRFFGGFITQFGRQYPALYSYSIDTERWNLLYKGELASNISVIDITSNNVADSVYFLVGNGDIFRIKFANMIAYRIGHNPVPDSIALDGNGMLMLGDNQPASQFFVWQYNPNTEQWSKSGNKSLSDVRQRKIKVVSSNGNIYAILDRSDVYKFSYKEATWKYDGFNNSMTFRRIVSVAESINGSVFITENDKVTEYDGLTSQFKAILPPIQFTPNLNYLSRDILYLATDIKSGSLYALAEGWSSKDDKHTVERLILKYNSSLKQWQELNNLFTEKNFRVFPGANKFEVRSDVVRIIGYNQNKLDIISPLGYYMTLCKENFCSIGNNPKMYYSIDNKNIESSDIQVLSLSLRSNESQSSIIFGNALRFIVTESNIFTYANTKNIINKSKKLSSYSRISKDNDLMISILIPKYIPEINAANPFGKLRIIAARIIEYDRNGQVVNYNPLNFIYLYDIEIKDLINQGRYELDSSARKNGVSKLYIYGYKFEDNITSMHIDGIGSWFGCALGIGWSPTGCQWKHTSGEI